MSNGWYLVVGNSFPHSMLWPSDSQKEWVVIEISSFVWRYPQTPFAQKWWSPLTLAKLCLLLPTLRCPDFPWSRLLLVPWVLYSFILCRIVELKGKLCILISQRNIMITHFCAKGLWGTLIKRQFFIIHSLFLAVTWQMYGGIMHLQLL